MATGDTADIKGRLLALLPPWFNDLGSSPYLSAVLSALATTQAYIYGLITYARLQLRIKTATDGWLDMVAADYFGPTFYRHAGQTDASYRVAIVTQLLRERGTRTAVIKVLTDITGRVPRLVEFNRPTDTGVWRGPYIGYGLAGAYGSITPAMRMQAFVIAYRPLSLGAAPLGYIPTDAEIIAAVEAVRPAGYTLWVAVSN